MNPLPLRGGLRRTPVTFGLLGLSFLAACGDDPVGTNPDPDPFTGDTLEAAASTLASEAMERIAYEPRAEDFSTDHPDVPGLQISFNSLIVSLTPAMQVGAVNGLLRDLDASIMGSIPGVPGETGGVLYLRLPLSSHEEMETALATVRSTAGIAAAAQDAVLGESIITNPGGADPGWRWDLSQNGGDWGMEAVRAPQLWNLKPAVDKAIKAGTTSGSILAIIDGGFAGAGGHEDLEPSKFTNITPSAVSYHGVSVAGVAGAGWNNGKGVDGIDPFTTIIGMGASNPGLIASWGDVLADDLESLVRDFLPRVVNVSMAYNWWSFDPPIDANTDTWVQNHANAAGRVVFDVLNTLAADGVRLPVITAAAGNDSDGSFGPQAAVFGSPMANAALEHGAANIIVVGATTNAADNRRAGFSNVGGHVSAPGVGTLMPSIPHTHPGKGSTPAVNHPNPYETHAGTSFAAPMVAGLTTFLYTLAGDLPSPTLTSNPVRDVLERTGVPAAGARPRIDAFAAALDLDRLRKDDRVLRMLVDMDDGSEDGNLRVDPRTGSETTNTDFDGDGGVGDGQVDMSDFRVWRDALVLNQLNGVGLDGSAQHPKKDLNQNGVWAPQSDDMGQARMDLNGDGLVDPNLTRFMQGQIGAEATDLDVLGRLFDDPHYEASELGGLTKSGDISIHTDFLLQQSSGVQAVVSHVLRASDETLIQQRTHTGGGEGVGPYQVYTLDGEPGAGPEPANRYLLRVEGWDGKRGRVFFDTMTVDLSPGQDIYWDPVCPLDDAGAQTGSTAQGSLCVQVTATPSTSFVFGEEQVTLTATVDGALDKSVTWSVDGPGTVTPDGVYTAPNLAEGTSVLAKVIAQSNADDLVADTALVVVSQPFITDPAPACTPTPSDDCGRDGRSWGDPHLQTPDGTTYDFMASGDYILAKSTDPQDDFQVQARYIQPEGDETFSWNNAAAMSVAGNVVEVYADGTDIPEVIVNGEPRVMRENGVNNFYDLEGGSVSLVGDSVSVSWPDRTLVMVKPSHVNGVLSEIRVSVPFSRNGSLEGLFGDFDGDGSNDVRVRGGAVLDPDADGLYTDFRQGWWVPFGSAESLFGQGIEHFDTGFPPGSVTIDDLEVDDVVRGAEVCRNAGVLDPEIMERCIIDVVLTGDDRWALVAAGVDPNTPGILVSPTAFFLAPGDSQEFGAIVTGTTDRRVEWSATGGTIVPTSDNIMTYTAPAERGTYTITGTLVADGTLVSTATVHVIGAPTGFSRQWNGSLSGDWYTPENWTPAGVPDSTDNVYVPAGQTNRASWFTAPRVNDLWIEAGASNAGNRAIYVRGNAEVDGEVSLVMTGSGKSVRGRVAILEVQGSVSASGPVEVFRPEGLLLHGGAFAVGPHRVQAGAISTPASIGAGRLIMNHPEGHLVVGGASFAGGFASNAGSLTAGTLEVVDGTFNLASSATFVATDEHRLVLRGDGSFASGISNGSARRWDSEVPLANQRINHLVIDNPAGAQIGANAIFVDGIVTLTTPGRVWDSSGSSSVHMSQALEDPHGAWEVPLVVRSPGVLLPPTLNTDLTFGGVEPLTVTLLEDLSVTGAVVVGSDAELVLGDRTLGVVGDLEVRTRGRLLVGSQELRVEGTLRTLDTGTIVMDTDGQRLVVTGDAVFGQGASTIANAGALFSAGVFEVGGNFSELQARYRPSGTHLTRFVGSGPQVAQTQCWYSDCGRNDGGNAPVFASVEVANPAGVTFQGRRIPISGDVRVLADAVATFNEWMDLAGSLDVAGSLSLTTGTQITVANTLFLRAAAVLTNDGTLTVGTCQKEEGATVTGTDPCQ